MQQDVRTYIEVYVICLGSKAKHHKPYRSLKSLLLPTRPIEELSMDFVTRLPEVLHRGELVDSILVIVDRFTKMTFTFIVYTTITIAQLVELFHRDIKYQFRPLKGLVTNRGSIFTS